MKIRQLTAELYGCEAGLDDAEKLLGSCKRAASSVGATVVGEARAVYQPHGITAIVFLAESHILLTTWPENNLLLVDILLCNTDMSTEKVLQEIKLIFCPNGQARTQFVERVIDSAPAQ